MKKRFLALFLSFAALSFVACDYNNPNDGKFGNDPQSGWVNFKSVGSATITGAHATLSVPVALNTVDLGYGPVNPIVNEDGLTVFYTLSGDGASLVSGSGEFSIPKGEREGNIVLNLPTTALTSCASFTITLTGTSRSNVQVGFAESQVPASSYITHNVTLGLGRDAFLGTYDVIDEGAEYEVTVTAGEQADEIVVHGFGDFDADSETSFFLTGADAVNNVGFLGYNDNFLAALGGNTGNVYLSNDFEVQRTSGYVPVHVPSSYDPCALSLNINYLVVFGPGQADFAPAELSFNAVLTKQ